MHSGEHSGLGWYENMLILLGFCVGLGTFLTGAWPLGFGHRLSWCLHSAQAETPFQNRNKTTHGQ